MSDSNSVTYINTSTNETRTLEEMVAAGWIALSEDSYGDAYQYPAIYSAGRISDENGAPIHAALDMSDGDQVGDWIVVSSSSVTYINTSNNETKTLEEMVAAGWIELSEDSYGDAYQYQSLIHI